MKIKNIDKWVNEAYHPYFRDYKTRTYVFYGGAGSGKSVLAAQKLIIKALQYERKVLVVRKVGTTLKDSVWALFLRLLEHFQPLVESVNKTDYTITLKNGSVLLFKGMDDREKIKSIEEITDIWAEEATELSFEDYTQLTLRLRSKKPYNQVILTFNPVSKANWVYKYFFLQEHPNTKIVRTTYKDNPHLPQEYIDSLEELQNTNPAYYRIYALGEFATLDKLVFPIIEKRIVTEGDTKDCLFWCGLDFGYTNDPSALTWGYFKPGYIYITGEYDRKGMTNDKVAEVIQDLGLSKEVIVADCAEQKSIAEIRKMGVRRIRPCQKGKDSVRNGLDKMLRCHIVIDERCPKTIEEFENYTWKKDKSTGEYYNEPIDAFNHHIDSIRYGLQPVINKRLDTEPINPMYL